jgi:hypothetical protein
MLYWRLRCSEVAGKSELALRIKGAEGCGVSSFPKNSVTGHRTFMNAALTNTAFQRAHFLNENQHQSRPREAKAFLALGNQTVIQIARRENTDVAGNGLAEPQHQPCDRDFEALAIQVKANIRPPPRWGLNE